MGFDKFKNNFFDKFLYFLSSLELVLRRIILLSLDFLLINLSLILSAWITDFTPEKVNGSAFYYYFLTSLTGIFIYLVSGQYKSITRFAGIKLFYEIFMRNHALIISSYLWLNILAGLRFPFRFWICLLLILSINISAFRILFIALLQNNQFKKFNKNSSIAIYGADLFGAQILNTLSLDGYKITCFIDDDSKNLGRFINGVPIISPKSFKKYINKVDKILVAIPSIEKNKFKSIYSKFEEYNIPVFQIPSVEDLIGGKVKISNLKPISIEDLLCREEISINFQKISPSIRESTVCITGAGGSIGSELCKQIISLKPIKLILIDTNESNLYLIHQELINNFGRNTDIHPLMVNVTNKKSMIEIFTIYKVDIVFHAAAYKHVPLVESNPIQGIYNNVFSTHSACEAAIKCKVKSFVLISSDMAVRPKNVMGATKRLSELLIKAYANKANQLKIDEMTIFSMVRFGNVLGSSGSVVPLFKKQISKGGPITITHPDVVRYFMSIPEAALLVIQAAILAQGGETFLLDMGKPVRIFDLAKQMVSLSGLTLKTDSNPFGDIEIIYSGLRPGEKLFEELLIDDLSERTSHPLIFKAIENPIDDEKFWKEFEKFKNLFELEDKKSILKTLAKFVPDWEMSEVIKSLV